MKPHPQPPEDFAAYIAPFPDDVQRILTKVRAAIRKAAPAATESIKYQLPTFEQNGNLVHFGAFKNHIGFYATPSGNSHFQSKLAAYKGGKGSVQFPFDRPIPYDLISEIVRFRVLENTAKATAKRPGPTRANPGT